MKRGAFIIAVLVAAGCGAGEDRGTAPPPTKPMTEAEIAAMPPQARAAMEAAQRRGAEMQRTRGVNGAVGGQ